MFGAGEKRDVVGSKMTDVFEPLVDDPMAPPVTNTRPSGSIDSAEQNVPAPIGTCVIASVAGSQTCAVGVDSSPRKKSTLPDFSSTRCTATAGHFRGGSHWPTSAGSAAE